MATFTAGDQINRALSLLGVLADGETPSASESNSGLTALQQMLDSWSTESLSVFCTTEQVFTWPAGQVRRTLGPTGDFVAVRPVLLDPSTYFVDPASGISFPIELVSAEDYNSIALKTSTSTYPDVMSVNMLNPNIEMFLFPVPSKALSFRFVSAAPLDQPPTLETVLVFPPGYLRAVTYNLAVEMAPEFGMKPDATIKTIAMSSKRNLKRINQPNATLSMPAGLAGRSRFNILTGR